MTVGGDLGFELHRLTAALDKAADRILVDAGELSYRRFLTLLLVGELGHPTQRQLADALGVSEPSASRMIGILTASGHLEADRASGAGNRKRLRLTPAGRQTVERCHALLERRVADLLEASAVPYDSYAQHTRALYLTLTEQGRARPE